MQAAGGRQRRGSPVGKPPKVLRAGSPEVAELPKSGVSAVRTRVQTQTGAAELGTSADAEARSRGDAQSEDSLGEEEEVPAEFADVLGGLRVVASELRELASEECDMPDYDRAEQLQGRFDTEAAEWEGKARVEIAGLCAANPDDVDDAAVARGAGLQVFLRELQALRGGTSGSAAEG
eukprot:Hpha_TRINITY_DN12911_c0_g2::TRINITY_DN12911_c0_g2_i1::g.164731::m.164731